MLVLPGESREMIRRPRPGRVAFPLRSASLLAVLALVPLLAAPGWAQQAAEAPAAPQVEAPAGDLAATVEAGYEVLPTREGLLLRPLAADAGARAIEIAGGEVAVDGVVIAGEELAERLGDDAAAVERLAALDAAEARALFGFGVAEVAPPPEATSGAPAPPVPPAPPAPPERPNVQVETQVGFGGTVTVQKDETAPEAVAIGGSVRVLGEVSGDAVAVGGSVEIDGTVHGEVVAVGGAVRLGPEARVDGNVTSVGGTVQREPGASIGGQVAEVAVGGGRWGRHGPWSPSIDVDLSPFGGRIGDAADVFGKVFSTLVLVLLAWLVVLIARGPVERVSAKLRSDFWMSALTGLLVAVLFFPVLAVVVLILLISVIGIPLLILVPVALLALLIFSLLGYTAVARVLAGLLERRFGWRLQGAFLSVLVGVAAIQVWGILAAGLDVVGGPLWFFVMMLWLFGLVLEAGAWIVGLGAVILTRFGAGPRRMTTAVAPAPEPGELPAAAEPHQRDPDTGHERGPG